jgi:hypothetical protein
MMVAVGAGSNASGTVKAMQPSYLPVKSNLGMNRQRRNPRAKNNSLKFLFLNPFFIFKIIFQLALCHLGEMFTPAV